MQSDAFNRSHIRTIVTVALTTNLRRVEAPGNVLIPKHASGLPKDSVANVSQLVTVDRTQLIERARRLPAPAIQAIERGLKLVLDL